MSDNIIKPSIEELEVLMKRGDINVEILPDGSINITDKPKPNLPEILKGIADVRKDSSY